MSAFKVAPRAIFAAAFLMCAGLLGFGLVLQHLEHLEPCPMCILQRYAFVLCGLIALAAALHDTQYLGRKIYAALLGMAAIGGGAVALRQSWIQHFPPEIADCGPDLAFMLDSFPLAQALPMIFRGAGDCTKVAWSLLGLSIAEWALLWFTLIAVAAFRVMFIRPVKT